MTDMRHRHIFLNSLLPHLKYPLRKQNFQTQVEALQEALQLEEKKIPEDKSNNRGVEGGLEESNISIKPEQG
jgi:hypothetical protein